MKTVSIHLGEQFVASNAYSLSQSICEEGWIIKGIEKAGVLIGFTMYGLSPHENVYDLCRFMIDYRYQGKGYGQEALSLIINTMKEMYACTEIYLSTEPNNARDKHLYEKIDFKATDEICDGEEMYCLHC